MARFRTTVDVSTSQKNAFEYLTDFANTVNWDPGVILAERLGEGELGVGSRFRVVSAFLGSRVTLTYRLAESEPIRRLVFEGGNATVHSRDEITLERVGRRTRVTYDAELTLPGLLRFADPLLHLAFQPLGRRAAEGLVRGLERHAVRAQRSRARRSAQESSREAVGAA